MDLPLDFKELLAELASSKVEAVIVGGYAVAFLWAPSHHESEPADDE